jgi:hypothetical protein
MSSTETRPVMDRADTPGSAPGHRVAPLASIKVQPRHLERGAVVYIRQSTERQVRDNPESRELQYALVDYATSMGWLRERVSLMDDVVAGSDKHFGGIQCRQGNSAAQAKPIASRRRELCSTTRYSKPGRPGHPAHNHRHPWPARLLNSYVR